MQTGFELFPPLNATLNGTSAVLLAVGHRFIKRGSMAAHRACMIAAVVCSTVFLASYLWYHAHVGSVRYPLHDWTRTLYLCILGTHTVMAATIVPMVIGTLTFALRGRFERHRSLARWTYPIWMYVSVTGVIIYLMLYQWAHA